jgi:crotonobetainyl-CoA:carnitine CoA-transferase CaiB-like acyl-CoA transferase
MDVLEEPALKTDPLYATQTARVANRERINAIVAGKLARETTAHWVAVMNRAGVPCGPVYGVDEVFRDPQVQAQEMVVEFDQPGHGPVKVLGFPMKFSETPCRIHRAAPELGQHTGEVLRELGYSQAECDALHRMEVI